jgi:hypothetical protein
LKNYAEKRVAKILPHVTKLEAKNEDRKVKESKDKEHTTGSPADQSVMSNASAKTAAEIAIRLKTA